MTIRFFRLSFPPDWAGPVFMIRLQLLFAPGPTALEPNLPGPSPPFRFIDLVKSGRIKCPPVLRGSPHYGRVTAILSISSRGLLK